MNEKVIPEIENKDERKWFAYLKQKAKDLNFGCLEMSVIIKGGKIVAFRAIKEVNNFNVRGD
jgi:hypothetical protein